jgi:ATP synthase I subunit
VGHDAFLRRLESTAIVACVAMAVIALTFSRGRPGPAVGVLGGGLLIAVSYWTIASGVNVLGASTGRKPAPRLAWTMMKVIGRYALLALLAYVMIARLRLHPLGLLAGASSVVVAASVEAFRLLLKKS